VLVVQRKNHCVDEQPKLNQRSHLSLMASLLNEAKNGFVINEAKNCFINWLRF